MPETQSSSRIQRMIDCQIGSGIRFFGCARVGVFVKNITLLYGHIYIKMHSGKRVKWISGKSWRGGNRC